MWAGEQRKVVKQLSFENYTSQNKHEVSPTIYVDRRANQRKIPKWLLFENYKSESRNT